MTKEQLVSALLPVLLTLLSGLGILAGSWIQIGIKIAKKKLSAFTSEEDEKLIQLLLCKVEDFIATAVTQTNQTFTESLKQSSTDGKLTKSEISEAFSKSKTNVLNLMGPEMLKELEKAVPDVQEWIKAKIEYYVNISK
jgi:hypothetical protein